MVGTTPTLRMQRTLLERIAERNPWRPTPNALDAFPEADMDVGRSAKTHPDVAQASRDVHVMIRHDYSCSGGVLDGVSRLAPLPRYAADRTPAGVTCQNEKQ